MGLPSAHSPLGASGAYRWLPSPYGGGCYGSVQLAQGIDRKAYESDGYDDGEFTKPGIAAHAFAEYCMRAGDDAWANIGNSLPPSDIVMDKEMADAVQVYINAIRQAHPERNQGNFWVERSFHCPSIHKLFYGTADAVYLDAAARALHVWDFKYGAGIIVEVENNPQTMYYACGVLEDLDLWAAVGTVTLHIAQPRGWHWKGPVRSWEISTPALEDWLEDVLIPGMRKALVSRDTVSGEHCRFCPVRGQGCPQLLKDQEEAWKLVRAIWPDAEASKEGLKKLSKMLEDGSAVDKLTNEQVARGLDLLDIMKIVGKAYEKTAFNRMANSGVDIPGRKLVPARTNREFKEGAEPEAKKVFGKRAYTEPALKSPAQIDELPGGTDFTARWAAKPEGKLTIAKADDARAPAKAQAVKELFKPVDKAAKAK